MSVQESYVVGFLNAFAVSARLGLALCILLARTAGRLNAIIAEPGPATVARATLQLIPVDSHPATVLVCTLIIICARSARLKWCDAHVVHANIRLALLINGTRLAIELNTVVVKSGRAHGARATLQLIPVDAHPATVQVCTLIILCARLALRISCSAHVILAKFRLALLIFRAPLSIGLYTVVGQSGSHAAHATFVIPEPPIASTVLVCTIRIPHTIFAGLRHLI
jgi:hypothetical protein